MVAGATCPHRLARGKRTGEVARDPEVLPRPWLHWGASPRRRCGHADGPAWTTTRKEYPGYAVCAPDRKVLGCADVPGAAAPGQQAGGERPSLLRPRGPFGRHHLGHDRPQRRLEALGAEPLGGGHAVRRVDGERVERG